MLFRIDPQSAEPIFEQIIYQVKDGVARGELNEGDKLPSVRELAKEVSVNPNTVIRSYDVLEGEGVIVRRQGAGCFVTGMTSRLSEDERRKRLDGLTRRAVTEAFHLGFDAADIRGSLERGLEVVRFESNRRSS